MATKAPKTPHKTVVYIDDDVDTITIAKLALRDMPYDLTTVSDATQSLELLREHQPDLVILDIMMPAMNGWDVLRQMREDKVLKDTPVIMVTARNSKLDEVYGTQIAKVSAYLHKPFAPQKFRDVIARVLEINDAEAATPNEKTP